MNEEYDSEVEGRERRVHQQKHDGAREESAHLVKAADRLDGPALARPGVVDAARQHCAAEQGLHLGRKTPQHLPTQNVDDREDADERQRESRKHQQCFEAAARQHAVGYLEQVHRHREHQQIHDDRKCHDRDQVRARDRTPGGQRVDRSNMVASLAAECNAKPIRRMVTRRIVQCLDSRHVRPPL